MRAILRNQRVSRRAHTPLRVARHPRLPALRLALRRLAHQVLPFALLIAAAGIGIAVWRVGVAIRSPLQPTSSATAASSDATPDAQMGADGRPVGSGAISPSRERDFEHVVEQGETLSEIAYLYQLDFSKLALYNNLSNPNSLKSGQKIVIPSLANAAAIKAPIVPEAANLATVQQAGPGQKLRIVADQQTDGRSVTARFSLDPGQDLDLVNYEWNLGNGRKSFRDTTYWTYDQPGTYTVALKAYDRDGRLHLSNRIYIDVPHPGTWASGDQRFVALDEVGDPFSVDGEIVGVLGYESVGSSPLAPAGAENGLRTYAANASGFFNCTVSKGSEMSHLFLFVSPIPSVHVDRADIDWYRTQFNTGTQSNCGPSVVSMAIGWAKGEYVSVASVRDTVGWQGDGGISFEDMVRVLRGEGIRVSMEPVYGVDDVIRIIDSGSIVVLLFNTRSVSRASGNPLQNLFGAYYQDNVGHYVLVKGYSKDRQWLVVYDPIPSDWSANSLRYGDGISMIGKNRYYSARELFSTLRRMEAMVVSR